MATLRERLIELRQGAWAKFIQKAPPSSVPYGTHIPILMAAVAAIQPKRVLELGAGLYSTALFLNRDYCPSIELLTSVETDPLWLQRIRAEIREDLRWNLQSLDLSVAEWLRKPGQGIDLEAYDLIFVDDSDGVLKRQQTLRALFKLKPSCVIVVHDVDDWRLRVQLWMRRPFVIFKAFSPQTGACNCRSSEVFAYLRSVSEELKLHLSAGRDALSLDDWIHLGIRAISHTKRLDLPTWTIDSTAE